MGWSDQNESDSIAALTRAWERKINHWDTADVYGDGQAEKIIGKMWKVIPRDDIFLATKVCRTYFENLYNSAISEIVRCFSFFLTNLINQYVHLESKY